MANNTEQPAMFDEIMAAQLTFFDKYKKPLIGGAVAILLAVFAFIGWKSWRDDQQQKACEAMFKAEQYFQAGEYEKALNGDASGALGMLQVAEEYSTSKAGNMARMYAGLCYIHTSKWQEAVDMLEQFDPEDDNMLSPAAVGALGNAYANIDQPEKAVKQLEKAAEMASNNTLSPIYLLQAGEIYESMNNKEAALKCYNTIKTQYPLAPQARTIDKYIERASK